MHHDDIVNLFHSLDNAEGTSCEWVRVVEEIEQMIKLLLNTEAWYTYNFSTCTGATTNRTMKDADAATTNEICTDISNGS